MNLMKIAECDQAKNDHCGDLWGRSMSNGGRLSAKIMTTIIINLYFTNITKFFC